MKNYFFLCACLLFLSFQVAAQQAQSREVSGILRSPQGEPLPGVSVRIKGTSQGTVTNIDGWYSIQAPVGAVLVYSFIGYASYEVTVRPDTSTPSTEAPKGRPSKHQQVKQKRTKALAGKRLRTLHTPEQERGVAILSDSAAGYQIQGSRALNNNRIHEPIGKITQNKRTGQVVLIPTRLVEQRLPGVRLEFSTAASRSTVNKLPSLQNQYAQGRTVEGKLQARGPETGELYSWGPALNTLAYTAEGQLVPGQAGLAPAKSFSPYSVFNAGIATENNLKLLARASDFDVQTAYAHKFSAGVLPTNQYGRHSFNVSVGTQQWAIYPKVYIHHSQAKEETSLQGANGAAVLGSLYTTPPSFDLLHGVSSAKPWKNTTTYLAGDGRQRSFAPGAADHPYWLLHRLPDQQHTRNTLYGLALAYTGHRQLELNYRLSLENNQNNTRFGTPPGAAAQPARLTSRELSSTGLHSNVSGLLRIRDTYETWQGEVHGGYSFHYQAENLLRQDGTVFDSPAHYTLEQAAALSRSTLQPYRRMHEVHTKAVFSWNGYSHWHLLELTLSNTTYFSNTLSAENRAYFMPAGSLYFNLLELEPFGYSSFFNLFSPYLSFSCTVQEAPLIYNQWHFSSLQLSPADYRQFYPQEELYAQAGLLPEKQRRFETGLNIEAMGRRLQLIASYFVNRTEDFIVPVYRDGDYQLENSATIRTPGLELSLNALGHFREGSWRAGLVFSQSRPVVEEIYQGQKQLPLAGFSTISTSLVEGQPYGVLVGSRFQRTEQGQLVIGSDGFPLVDPVQGILGNPTPDWTGGLSAQAEWHGISLSFVLDAKKGGDYWNGTQQFINYYGTSQLTAEQRMTTSYIFEGVREDGTTNWMPVDFYSPALPVEENRWQRYGEAGVAEEVIEDTSWLRLNSLQLSYTPSKKLLQGLPLQRVKFSLLATNVFVITRYSGTDPVGTLFGNAQARGLDLFNQPNVRSFGCALTINL